MHTRLQWVSGILEILGTLVVVVGLLERRQIFNGGEVKLKLADWLERAVQLFLPTPPPRVVSLSASLKVSSQLSATLTVSPSARTIEERVAQVEQELVKLKKESEARAEKLRDEIHQASKKLGETISAAKSNVVALESQLRRTAVGSLGSELMGLSWLMAGILVDSWPELGRAIAL